MEENFEWKYNLRKQLDWWHKTKAKTVSRENQGTPSLFAPSNVKRCFILRNFVCTLNGSIYKHPEAFEIAIWLSMAFKSVLRNLFFFGLWLQKWIKLYSRQPLSKWISFFVEDSLYYPICLALFNVEGKFEIS